MGGMDGQQAIEIVLAEGEKNKSDRVI